MKTRETSVLFNTSKSVLTNVLKKKSLKLLNLPIQLKQCIVISQINSWDVKRKSFGYNILHKQAENSRLPSTTLVFNHVRIENCTEDRTSAYLILPLIPSSYGEVQGKKPMARLPALYFSVKRRNTFFKDPIMLRLLPASTLSSF